MNEEIEKIQSLNRDGCIPIELSLASTSLSSPTKPSNINKLLPRSSYLHVALEKEIRYYQKYAPCFLYLFKSAEEPVEENIDSEQKEETDVSGTNEENDSNEDSVTTDEINKEEPFPLCWFEDEATGDPLKWQHFIGVNYDMIKMKTERDTNGITSTLIPWKIRIHFTSYPASLFPMTQIGDDDILKNLTRNYLNSLKQSLYIQHQSNKIGKNMTKDSHTRLWHSLKSFEFNDSFQEIMDELNSGNEEKYAVIEQVPIRLWIDDRPVFSRPCQPQQTLKDLLHAWLPNLSEFEFSWRIQGIEVSLECNVEDLWKTLCHPDRFLYISILTIKIKQ